MSRRRQLRRSLPAEPPPASTWRRLRGHFRPARGRRRQRLRAGEQVRGRLDPEGDRAGPGERRQGDGAQSSGVGVEALVQDPGPQIEDPLESRARVEVERQDVPARAWLQPRLGAAVQRLRRAPTATRPERGREALPRVPIVPSAMREQRSRAARSRWWSRPSTTSVHDRVARRLSGTARSRRRLELVVRAARGTPPGRQATATTPSGTPVGSAPTETAGERAASGTSISESLPGSPPRAPNSSPAISTRPAPIPRRRRNVADPAAGVGLVGQPDLDVLRVARHPSLGEPDLDGGPACELGRLGERADPVRRRGEPRPPPAARRFAPWADPPTPAPGSGRSCVGSAAARRSPPGAPARRDAPPSAPRRASSASSSASVATPREDRARGPCSPTRNTSEPRLSSR